MLSACSTSPESMRLSEDACHLLGEIWLSFVCRMSPYPLRCSRQRDDDRFEMSFAGQSLTRLTVTTPPRVVYINRQGTLRPPEAHCRISDRGMTEYAVFGSAVGANEGGLGDAVLITTLLSETPPIQPSPIRRTHGSAQHTDGYRCMVAFMITMMACREHSGSPASLASLMATVAGHVRRPFIRIRVLADALSNDFRSQVAVRSNFQLSAFCIPFDASLLHQTPDRISFIACDYLSLSNASNKRFLLKDIRYEEGITKNEKKVSVYMFPSSCCLDLFVGTWTYLLIR
jgi:hypothetical protein